jgi:thioredoxin reductase (NADPH)
MTHPTTDSLYDVGVVGGGPAGLSAALWLARYLHSVVLVDSADPRNWETRGVHGFLGLPQISPTELRGLGREECRKYRVTLVDAKVEHARKVSDDCFILELAGARRYETRRLLLAYGIRDVWPRPRIPGLGEVYGATAHVCPDCDGYATRGKKVVVLGSGRRAVGMALNLTTWTRDIIIVTHGADPAMDREEYCRKLDALNIPVLAERVVRVINRDGQLHALELEGGMVLDCDHLFFTIGQREADDLADELGCARDEEDSVCLDVDRHGHTTVRNVFAAGDLTPGPQLAVAAAAEGTIAALAIHKSLVPEERTLTPKRATDAKGQV